MAEAAGTTEGTEAEGHQGGLPQMDTSTYPSQLFWLAVTFAFLFVVMWRISLPKIGGAIEQRRHRITGDLESAERLSKDAQAALQAYETSLAQARGKALGEADENRKRIAADVDRAKVSADAEGQKAIAAADSRIQAARTEARTHIRNAAAEAAASIVERLIGERVAVDDAARAVETGS